MNFLAHLWLADRARLPLAGAILGDDIFVDGEYADSQEDAIMQFDRAAIHGIVLPGPAPKGMWAGRLGANAIVTIDPKGDPARARILERVGSSKAGAS